MKPPFLERPGLWTRAQRARRDPVTDADPFPLVESSSRWTKDEQVLFIAAAIALVLVALLWEVPA